MQTTIYYNEGDAYLVEQVDLKGRRERKSRSATILSILEEYFESEKRLGEILLDMGAVSYPDLAKSLELQKNKFKEKRLGEILLEQGVIEHNVLERALIIQERNQESKDSVRLEQALV